jgi:hypothetical protein
VPTTHVISDLVRQQTTTTGTGTLSLGTVPVGCRGVVAGIGDGKKARYKLSTTAGDWEVGLGTVTDGSPDTFSRDTVYASSAGGTTKITLPAGTHTLDITFDAKSANEMTPRLLDIGNGVTLSSGTLTVDCQRSCDVLAVVVLTGNVTTVVMSNLPERATVEMWVTHSGGPWTFPQNAWPAGTTLHGSYNLYTDSTITRFWWTTPDTGTSAILECNAPTSGLTASDVDDTPVNGETAAPISSNWAFDHTALTQAHGISSFGASLVDDASASAARTTLGLGTAATAATGDFAPVSEGVTNGNNHDHNGGDGAQIGTGGLANNVVTNAKLATMGAATFKGRSNTTAGDPEDMTAAQARALIEYAVPSAVTISGNTTLTAASHQGNVLYCINGALSLTVAASTGFDAYASCEIINKTGAVVTFVATATINRVSGKPLTLPANGRAILMRESTADVYLLTGEMA